MAVVLPVWTALSLLGTSFDLRNYDMGKQFFNQTDYETVKVDKMDARYMVLPQDSFPYDFFGIPPAIALLAKQNPNIHSYLNFGNLTFLVKNTTPLRNMVTVAFRFNYKSVDRVLKKDARTVDDQKSSDTKSTHYVSTVSYGGYKMVYFRFGSYLERVVQDVRRILTSVLGTEGAITAETVVAWKKATKALDKYAKGPVYTGYTTYGNVPNLKLEADVADNWVKIATDLPKAIEGDGLPLWMSLSSLHDVDTKYPLVEENMKESKNLEKVDLFLDDVQKAKQDLKLWFRTTQTRFDKDQRKMITTLVRSLDNARYCLLSIAVEASSFKSTDQQVFENCFEMYQDGLDDGSYNYYRNYLRLRQQIDGRCENAFEDGVKGLLRVNSTEFINLDEVKGGLEQCKTECFSRPQCRAIFYVEKIDAVEAVSDMTFRVKQQKQCQIYFRSSSTAEILVPEWLPKDAAIYDRKCML